MGISFLLKKEGLDNIKKLNTMQINKIASCIAEKLCSSFPDLHLSQSHLFMQLSRLDMYTAHMQDQQVSAKYVYGNNSIFFNENLDLNHIDIAAIHECIHYLQEFKNQKGKLIKLGLYDLEKRTGLALNEAAVQIIACRTSEKPTYESVTYYGMSFVSESPVYYPLECAILSQMTFFTGSEALYFSTLYSSPMFERNFKNISTENTYYEIQSALDKIMNLESELSIITAKYQLSSTEKLKLLQKQIDSKKKSITNLCIKTQNMIIDNCFKKQFTKLETFDDIREFENNLIEFEKYLILPDNYDYYTEFKIKMAKDINFKKDQIIKYGRSIDIPKEYGAYLPAVITTQKLSKIQSLLKNIKNLILGK